MVRTMLEKVAPDDAATKRIIANAAGATYLGVYWFVFDRELRAECDRGDFSWC
jgi:hypothetical protein